jgi:hypothetical protein
VSGIRFRGGGYSPILHLGDVAAGEDVRGGKGRGGDNAVEEEDFIFRGYEDDAGCTSVEGCDRRVVGMLTWSSVVVLGLSWAWEGRRT